jgi:hypothetical protein
MVVVVTGQTFHGRIAPAPIDRTPKRQPAFVRYDPAVALSLTRSLRHRVKFRLEYPTVVERNSRLDYVDPPYHIPVRVYEVGDHRAVRFVFSTGAPGAYWGIEETDWEDAPVLLDKSEHHVLKGRPYDFYYAGPRLHMIVLRENGATYWVVNTLRDELSNETMIAIAKGLRPLKK